MTPTVDHDDYPPWVGKRIETMSLWQTDSRWRTMAEMASSEKSQQAMITLAINLYYSKLPVSTYQQVIGK